MGLHWSSVSQSVSYFTVPPRAHPSTGSQSGSATPGLTQVPSYRVLAPGGYSCTQLSQVRSISPSGQGVPCRFLLIHVQASWCLLGSSETASSGSQPFHTELVAFGDRPILAHTFPYLLYKHTHASWGRTYPPRHEMGACLQVGETIQYGPVCMLTQTRPPLVRTHASNPAFPTRGVGI